MRPESLPPRRPGKSGGRRRRHWPPWPALRGAGSHGGPCQCSVALLHCRSGPILGSGHRPPPPSAEAPFSIPAARVLIAAQARLPKRRSSRLVDVRLSTASFRADSATLPGSPHPDPTLPLRCARRARGTKAGAVASRPSSQPSCPLAAATRTCAHTRNVKARGVVPSERPTEPHMPQWSATGSWSGTTRLAPRLPADLASA